MTNKMTVSDIRKELLKRGVQFPHRYSKKEEYKKLLRENTEEEDDYDERSSSSIQADSTSPTWDDDDCEKDSLLTFYLSIISQMNDSSLYDCLVKAGKNSGPVTISTRSVYEKLLAYMWKNNPGMSPLPAGLEGHSNFIGDYETVENASTRTPSRSSSVSTKMFENSSKPKPDTHESDKVSSKYRTPRPIQLDTSAGLHQRLAEGSGDQEFDTSEGSVENHYQQGQQQQRQQNKKFWDITAVILLLVAIIGVLCHYLLRNQGGNQDELDDILAEFGN